MNIIVLSKEQRIGFAILFIFVIQILNIHAYEQRSNDEEEEDSFDVGIRLTGGKQDSLIADLIADERNIMNAGQVCSFEIRRSEKDLIW